MIISIQVTTSTKKRLLIKWKTKEEKGEFFLCATDRKLRLLKRKAVKVKVIKYRQNNASKDKESKCRYLFLYLIKIPRMLILVRKRLKIIVR